MRSDQVPHSTPMGQTFTLAPTVAANQRAALEHLLYFNVNQERVRLGIQKSIERYGVPEILEKEGRLSVRVGTTEGTQTVFAVSEFGHPLGVAVFTRLPPGRVVVLHVGVLPRLRSTSEVNAQVLLELIHEVQRVARAVEGVDRIEVVYSRHHPIPKPGIAASH
jgi:hypothetical protein